MTAGTRRGDRARVALFPEPPPAREKKPERDDCRHLQHPAARDEKEEPRERFACRDRLLRAGTGNGRSCVKAARAVSPVAECGMRKSARCRAGSALRTRIGLEVHRKSGRRSARPMWGRGRCPPTRGRRRSGAAPVLAGRPTTRRRCSGGRSVPRGGGCGRSRRVGSGGASRPGRSMACPRAT